MEAGGKVFPVIMSQIITEVIVVHVINFTLKWSSLEILEVRLCVCNVSNVSFSLFLHKQEEWWQKLQIKIKGSSFTLACASFQMEKVLSVAEDVKNIGNNLFKSQDWKGAVKKYSKALR